MMDSGRNWSSRSPLINLRQLERDKANAKAEIRTALDRLAAKHGTKARAINCVMADYAAHMLDDATYEVQRELEFESQPEVWKRSLSTRTVHPRGMSR
jgi:hypothetical protein